MPDIFVRSSLSSDKQKLSKLAHQQAKWQSAIIYIAVNALFSKSLNAEYTVVIR